MASVLTNNRVGGQAQLAETSRFELDQQRHAELATCVTLNSLLADLRTRALHPNNRRPAGLGPIGVPSAEKPGTLPGPKCASPLQYGHTNKFGAAAPLPAGQTGQVAALQSLVTAHLVPPAMLPTPESQNPFAKPVICDHGRRLSPKARATTYRTKGIYQSGS